MCAIPGRITEILQNITDLGYCNGSINKSDLYIQHPKQHIITFYNMFDMKSWSLIDSLLIPECNGFQFSKNFSRIKIQIGGKFPCQVPEIMKHTLYKRNVWSLFLPVSTQNLK